LRGLGLLLQVEEVAVQKHGSLAAVAEEKQRRVKGKIEGRVRRRAAEQQAAAAAQEVAARVQAAVGRHSRQPGDQQVQEEGECTEQHRGLPCLQCVNC
jgi:hypothetical protein